MDKEAKNVVVSKLNGVVVILVDRPGMLMTFTLQPDQAVEFAELVKMEAMVANASAN